MPDLKQPLVNVSTVAAIFSIFILANNWIMSDRWTGTNQAIYARDVQRQLDNHKQRLDRCDEILLGEADGIQRGY